MGFFFLLLSYFVVLRIGGVFGVFAASYFIVLRIGEFLGVLGFLLLHTLSFCELVGFLGFLLLHSCHSERWWVYLPMQKPHQFSKR